MPFLSAHAHTHRAALTREAEPDLNDEVVIVLRALAACWVAGVGIIAPAKAKKGKGNVKGKGKAGGASGAGSPNPDAITVAEAVALCRMLEQEFQENGEEGSDKDTALALLARTRAALGGR